VEMMMEEEKFKKNKVKEQREKKEYKEKCKLKSVNV
jgi:hypothetical protein